METKDKTTNKLPYIPAEISVIRISTNDIITVSGFDDLDNWIEDKFYIE